MDEDYNTIVALKISSKAHQDLYGWHYNEDGIYTVKSGYWPATHLPNQNFIPPTYGNVDLKQKVWKTKTPSKVQHFLWKLLSRSLATGNNLRKRHITNDTICKRCYMEEETEEHLFFTCPYVKQIWRASGVANPVFDDPNELLDSKVKVCMEFASSSRLVHFQNLPIWLLWDIWKSRNKLIFQKKNMHWKTVLRYAKDDAQEWKGIDFNDGRGRATTVRQNQECEDIRRWSLPTNGRIKCNVDGSFRNENTEATAGWLYRDEEGQYKGSAQARGMKVGTALEGELQAILMAIQHCWTQGFRRIIIESDCRKAIDIINKKTLHFNVYNWTREIRWWEQKFEEITFQWIKREGNKPADRLAKTILPNMNSFYFHYYVPKGITNLLHEDYVLSHLV